MPPTTTQQPLSTDQAKAALGNATYLQEQLLSQQGSQQTQSGSDGTQTGTTAPETATGAQAQPPVDAQSIVQELAPQIAEMVKGAVQEQMDAFRKEIKGLLEDDKQSESTKTSQ